MIQSMTGFGSRQKQISGIGKFSVELKSTNHKFLEIVLHLPEGFLAWEEKIKKEIEAQIKRGRITGVVSINGIGSPAVYINQEVLKNYLAALKNIQRQIKSKEPPSIDTLVNLPGVVSLAQEAISPAGIWPKLKTLVEGALLDLVQARSKEGRALAGYLKSGIASLEQAINYIQKRFKKVIKEKIAQFNTDEERSAFLKEADINEEIERLVFHLRNFRAKLVKAGPVGKELDFIAQELQREANTLAAKSCDIQISAKVVQAKSQIEKLREQLQNIE